VADWGRRVFVGALLGAVLGVLLGLVLARVLLPVPEVAPLPSPVPSDTPTSIPPAPIPNVDGGQPDFGEAVVLMSALYALDGDTERAQQRLEALGLDDPATTVAELALEHAAAGNRQVATDLATLAAALGQEQGEWLAYVATATPTDTSTPPPTATATASPSPSPTASPTPSPTSTNTPTTVPSPLPPATAVPTQGLAATKPPTASPPRPVSTPLPLDWDYRVSMLSPPVKHRPADVAPGETYWRLVSLEWWKPDEGGNTMIYASAIDEDGQPVWGQEVIIENGGHTVLYTDPKPGEHHGVNFHMTSTLNSYQAFVGGDLPSDRVTGMGLGLWLGGLDHTAFVLVFQRTTN
jgi:hypothetical protein